MFILLTASQQYLIRYNICAIVSYLNIAVIKGTFTIIFHFIIMTFKK